MNSDSTFILCMTALILATAGDPDIIDSTIAVLQALAKHLGG